MAFTMVRGGRPVDPDVPSWERVLDERAAAADSEEATEEAPNEHLNGDEDGEDGEQEKKFEDAIALNQRLKAMIAEAAASKQRSNGASDGRTRQQPQVPRLPGFASSPAGYSQPSRESSQGINRRRLDQQVQKENAGFAARLAGSKSCILPPVSQRPGQQESSQSINRRKFAEKVQRENATIVARIEQPHRSKSWAPPRMVGEAELPKGWSRGIGGRAMPPPKLRWGAKPKYDAGEMCF